MAEMAGDNSAGHSFGGSLNLEGKARDLRHGTQYASDDSKEMATTFVTAAIVCAFYSLPMDLLLRCLAHFVLQYSR